MLCSSEFDEPAIWDCYNGWSRKDDCIWDGPDFMEYRPVLSRQYGGDDHLQSFFKTVLDIRDWNIEDVMETLEMLPHDETRSSPPSIALTCSIYTFLNSNVQSEEDWRNIK